MQDQFQGAVQYLDGMPIVPHGDVMDVDNVEIDGAALQQQHNDALLHNLNVLFDKWKYVPSDAETYASFGRRVFGLSAVGPLDIKTIERQKAEKLKEVLELYYHFTSNGMVGDRDQETLNSERRFARLIEAITHAWMHLDTMLRGAIVMDENHNEFVPKELSLFRVSTIDVSENNPQQNLILFYLNNAFTKGFRRYKSQVYEQIYTVDGPDGLPTHAWKPVCTIEEYVYNSIKRETNYQQWKNLTHGSIKSVLEYMKKSRNDGDFPWLAPDRTITAWRNGLYLAETKEFIRYEDASRQPDKITPSTVACKFFDHDFYEEPTPAGPDGWFNLPTPAFDSILDFQRLPLMAKKMLYVMIGRIRYEMGTHDRWHAVPFVKGMAGTGKSTIGKYVLNMFEFSDVGILSANMEDKFGLSALLYKFCWACLEVKERFALPQSEFQSMISGEHMNIPVKFADAVSIIWSTPGFLAGNELAAWIDAAGSMSRRLFIFEFLYNVINANPMLDEDLKKELGVFVRKVNEGYRSYADRYGAIDIWNIPGCEYFMETRMRAQAVINPVVAFIRVSEVVELKPGGCMPMKVFRERFAKWSRDNGRRPALERDMYIPVFQQFDISLEHQSADYKGALVDGLWAIGVEEKMNR